MKLEQFKDWAEQEAKWLLLDEDTSELKYLMPSGFICSVGKLGKNVAYIDNGEDRYISPQEQSGQTIKALGSLIKSWLPSPKHKPGKGDRNTPNKPDTDDVK